MRIRPKVLFKMLRNYCTCLLMAFIAKNLEKKKYVNESSRNFRGVKVIIRPNFTFMTKFTAVIII